MSELETQARDRSDNQAAVAQIEVTPEMIEAGANRVFELWGEVSTAYLVREVFQAMMRERRYSGGSSEDSSRNKAHSQIL